MTDKLLLSAMQDHGAWEEPTRLRDFLAEQLSAGRLCLVLGAGVSVPFGLPNWTELVNRGFAKFNAARNPKQNDEVAAEELLVKHCGRDRIKFAEVVRDCLYEGLVLSMEVLRKHELLAAIVAMTMGSDRGSVASVLTFNFDDLVERFLTYYGFFVESVATVPAWDSRADTRAFHIHGSLPSDRDVTIPGPIVMTQADFDAVTGKDSDVWRSLMVSLFRSHTCIFLGLSGADKNLSSALMQVRDGHPSKARGDAYWGVRFCMPDDPLETHWTERGVYCAKLSSYDELPSRLFQICQTASEQWRKRYT